MGHQSPWGNYGHAVLTANALRSPDRVALTYRGQHTTFDALNRQVNRIANTLSAAGVGRRSRVGSLLSDCSAIARLYPAEAKIGAVLAAFNPWWPEEQVVATVRLSLLDTFVFDSANAAVAARIRPQLPQIERWLAIGGARDGAIDLDRLAAEASDAEPILAAFDSDPLALFYTSGTTGISKAVSHTHASTKSMSEFLLELPHDDSHVWGTGPIIWGVGYPCTLGAALNAGMRVALEDDFGPAKFLEAVQRERISHVAMIPSQWADLLANYPHENYDLSSLQVILLGAEPIGSALLRKMLRRLPGVQVYAFYGQTEAPYTCIGRLTETPPTPEGVGRPRASVAVRITDPSGKRITGEAGDIGIAGPHRMAGYFGQPERNAESLKEGWFMPGDLGRLDDSGRLHVLGRKEDAIVRAGRYIRPLEIEDVAMTIPGVAEAGAVGTPAGAAEQKIILAVAPDAGRELDEPALRAALDAKLPESHRPDLIVVAPELPHGNDASGGRGKLLRRTIRDLYESRLLGG